MIMSTCKNLLASMQKNKKQKINHRKQGLLLIIIQENFIVVL